MNSRRHSISKVAQGSIDALLPMHTLGLFTNPIADQASIIDAVEVVRLTGSYKNRPGFAELMFDGIWGGIRHLTWAWCKAVERFPPYWFEEAFATERMESFVKTQITKLQS